MITRDLYPYLDLTPAATAEEIKRAYRRLAQAAHPDNGGSAERFQAIAEAYEVLRDPAKRAHHDRALGYAAENAGTPTSAQLDLKIEIGIELRDAATGCAREIRYQRMLTCAPCRGVRCIRCAGTRRYTETASLTVAIPAGIEDSARLRYPQNGNVIEQAIGDLYVVLRVQRNPHFRRAGRDLYTDLPVPYPTLVLGGSTNVKTLTGDTVPMDIDAYTVPGTRRRLVGLGMPTVNDTKRGDLYVTLEVQMPHFLSAQARSALASYNLLLENSDR